MVKEVVITGVNYIQYEYKGKKFTTNPTRMDPKQLVQLVKDSDDLTKVSLPYKRDCVTSLYSEDGTEHLWSLQGHIDEGMAKVHCVDQMIRGGCGLELVDEVINKNPMVIYWV